MSDNVSKINKRIIFAAIALCIMAGLLAVGTFNDKSISDSLYSVNFFSRAVGVIGPMPLFFVIIPMAGALAQRSLQKSGAAKIIGAAISVALIAALSYLAAKAFTSSDCLDSVFPSIRGKMWLIIPIALAVFMPLGFLGYKLAGKTTDEKLARRIVMLLLAIVAAYAFQEVLKGMMHRPRYRTAIQGYEGVGFIPWYEKFKGYSKELAENLGLHKDEFASFPSGHSMMSMACFISFPALSWLFKSLQGKELQLAVCGAVYSVTVMFSRIMAGAHYLSDVSASGVIMLTVSIIYMILLKRTYKEEK